ncbi:MAG: UDP-N-acetylmuramate--L-alanine ligase [Sulfuricurvum sp. GWF2_44_89]|uniref:UDP-N-acetylmuramate--L-alanine ligase n=1 Tax=Sulfuricurvum kujiense TaxID=148813 RepID=A0A2D3WPE9_9BACT|nr:MULTISPECIES: UDP-N-acetylmuramate--L-alanine ligase [Sulfuricurvum]OHD77165.1 MAG: UDP-N-acetylmuramate--L-alanine ligase [Sulfuricurvum sp. GWF2_44_89]OHD92710.1 MAG: UDP-N-acetylmuramate--L-alanine ligase [Sulfuricurvum sp. RIFOXYD12_FULL_44_77]OHD99790.1 MAG: UDP-N-acetylmuramate--L-alanine ligase [Sulfuricurvum sp. RIFOXYD2_FULL_44_160]DAB38563.1 MAG TPA: UDP-N-acetylmuramate--L-alanine ligase [Sulfuricurvum kujiense]
MKIHFIGIGGIGISGLAKYMRFSGHDVSGSDMKATHITQRLIDRGITVHIGHDAANIPEGCDLVIHSAIIRPTNSEIVEAHRRGIEVLHRRDALLRILSEKKVYAVCGAHGKSTTTAILAAIMDGSAIIGAESKGFGSNVRYDGSTDVMLFEADESDGSFLNSNPYCSIVTNAEPEHMEYYNYNIDEFHNAYLRFIEMAPVRVINAEDPFMATLECDALRLYPSQDITNITYTLLDDEPYTRFHLKGFGEFEVWGFGEHIAMDASLAIMAAAQTMSIASIRVHLLNFRGIKKRFDVIFKGSDRVIIDDYAHHPTEIKATMQSLKTYAELKGFKRIIAIWQPHKYSRTIDNLDAFALCFEGCAELVILPVWAASEEPREIDFEGRFSRYNLTMSDKLHRAGDTIESIIGDTVVQTYDHDLIVGFGAGDLTYQLRGTK